MVKFLESLDIKPKKTADYNAQYIQQRGKFPLFVKYMKNNYTLRPTKNAKF